MSAMHPFHSDHGPKKKNPPCCGGYYRVRLRKYEWIVQLTSFPAMTLALLTFHPGRGIYNIMNLKRIGLILFTALMLLWGSTSSYGRDRSVPSPVLAYAVTSYRSVEDPEYFG